MWYSDKIAAIIEEFDSNLQAQLLIHDLAYCDAELNVTGQTKLNRIRGRLGRADRYVTGMATAVRRPFLDFCLPFPEESDLAHDDWLHKMAEAIGGRFVLPRVLALYRRHVANVTISSQVNSARSQSLFRVLSQRTAAPTIQPVRRTHKHLRLVSQALTNRKHQLDTAKLLSQSEYESAVRRIETAMVHHQRRLALLQCRRFKRPIGVFRLLLTGGYSRFNGAKSAMKDLIVR